LENTVSIEKLRVAIVGSGMIANAAHIPAWKAAAGAELAAVMDVNPESADATAQRHGVPRRYTDLERMLEEVRPDVVSVCSPAAYHKQHTLAALAAGAHVLCEKPLTPHYADAVEMFDAAAAARRHLFVGQSMRFYNQVEAVREFAAAGELGEMYCAQASRLRRRGVPQHGVFHIRAHSGGGVLYDMGTHVLDMVLWIMGNPTVVSASGVAFRKLAHRDEGLLTSQAESGAFAGVFEPRPYDRREFDVDDMAAAFLRLEGGGSISLQVSWAVNLPESAGGVWIAGADGGVQFDPRFPDVKLVRNLGRYQVDITPKIPPPEPNHPFYAHWKQAAHFVRVIRGEEELRVRPAEVLNATRALEGVYRSAEEGREVRLDAAVPTGALA
jgi:predicted dehydrogenase